MLIGSPCAGAGPIPAVGVGGRRPRGELAALLSEQRGLQNSRCGVGVRGGGAGWAPIPWFSSLPPRLKTASAECCVQRRCACLGAGLGWLDHSTRVLFGVLLPPPRPPGGTGPMGAAQSF